MSRDGAPTDDRLRILLAGEAESTDWIASALSAGLESASVTVVETVADAPEREPHCVVCDLESSGFDAIDRPRAPTPDRPIVAVADGDAAERALEAGAIDVLAPDAPHVVAVSRVRTVAERERFRRLAATTRDPIESTRVLEWVAAIDDVERDLVGATGRDEVERRLCEGVRSAGLPGSATVELAWIGTVTPGGETVEARTAAGPATDALESLSIPADEESPAPTGRAIAAGETVVTDVAEVADADEDGGTDRRPRVLRDWEIRSVLSTPLAPSTVRRGTLTVCADRPGAFDGRVRPTVERLAAAAGVAIEALETKRALTADAVTELEVVLRDASEPLSALARPLDRRLEVRAVVPRSSGGSTVFCTTGATAEEIRAADVTALRSVDAVEIVAATDEGTSLEVRFGEETVAEPIAAHGGVVGSIEPSDGRTRLRLELAGTADVRSVVRTLDRRYGATLVARVDRERPIGNARPVGVAARERLSERQLRTLEAAYHGGFFAWPRESTGEDVADALGVSQPTFSRHVRVAQRKLLSLLFDESDERG